jgi:hypothetical protein
MPEYRAYIVKEDGHSVRHSIWTAPTTTRQKSKLNNSWTATT